MLLPVCGVMMFLHVDPILAQTDAQCEMLYGVNCNHHEDELRQEQLQRQQPVQAPSAITQSPEFYHYGREVRAALERGDLQAALVNIRRAMRVEIVMPSMSGGAQIGEQLILAAIAEPYTGYVSLGDLYLRLGEIGSAAVLYRHALRYNPNGQEARLRLSYLQ